MDNQIKIECPSCHTRLSVGYFEGIEAKSFACPKCHKVHKFTEYASQESNEQESDETDLRNVIRQKGQSKAATGKYAEEENDTTHFEKNHCMQIGNLRDALSGTVFQLKKGRNVIGRKASSSTADIQITDSSCTMSREHFYIDVLVQSGKVLHIMSVCPKAINATMLDNTVLGTADKLMLHNGSLITIASGKVHLVFNIPQ